jgi:hypothetical protein
MKQSKLMSLAESVINIAVGFGISLAAQCFFLPLLGVAISFSQNLVFALIMTAISIARSYLLRRVFEALHIRRPLSPFAQAVIAERFRQIEQEGWSADHDDRDHGEGTLAQAGAAYAIGQRFVEAHDVEGRGEFLVHGRMIWPWDVEWWKPAGLRRNYVKAAALIIAEGEKFDRSRSKRGRS